MYVLTAANLLMVSVLLQVQHEQSPPQHEQLSPATQVPAHQEAALQLSGLGPLVLDPDPPYPPLRSPSTAHQHATGSTDQDSRAWRRPALQSFRRMHSALSSGRSRASTDSPREVRFISPAPSATLADFQRPPLHPQAQPDSEAECMQDATVVNQNEPGTNWQQRQPVSALARMTSSMKRSMPKPSLRRRSFNRQASSVSFAPTVSGDSDSSTSEDTRRERRNSLAQEIDHAFAQPGSAVTPVLRTVSSVWQAITSIGRGGETASGPQPLYQPARPNSPDGDDTPPHVGVTPPSPHVNPLSPASKARTSHLSKPPCSAASLWQAASHRAAAELAAESPADSAHVTAQSASGSRVPSRFGSFWGAVAQAAIKQPIPPQQQARPNVLSQEHLALGVQMLLHARRNPNRLSSSQSMGGGQQRAGVGPTGRQPSLANVVRALSTSWHLDQPADEDPTSQVCWP